MYAFVVSGVAADNTTDKYTNFNHRYMAYYEEEAIELHKARLEKLNHRLMSVHVVRFNSVVTKAINK